MVKIKRVYLGPGYEITVISPVVHNITISYFALLSTQAGYTNSIRL